MSIGKIESGANIPHPERKPEKAKNSPQIEKAMEKLKELVQKQDEKFTDNNISKTQRKIERWNKRHSPEQKDVGHKIAADSGKINKLREQILKESIEPQA